MDRGRVGSLKISNRSCARKVWEKQHHQHCERINQVKPRTDMSLPVTAHMDHVRNNLKKEQQLEGRYMEIDRENQILLRKMSEIMRKPNPYIAEDGYYVPPSRTKDGRRAELMRITKENHRLLKSLQEVQPVYSVKRWEDSHRKSGVMVRNLSTYPVITRLPRNKSSPSVLMRVGGEAAPEPGSVSSTNAAFSPADDLRYMLKEGKKIGDTYYLVEMMTDGRALNISAYDGDSQRSLELVVSEKNHRQLYRETQGDYSAIANKLRVDGDRLRLKTATEP